MTKKKAVVYLTVNRVPCPPEKVKAYREGMLALLNLLREIRDREKEKNKNAPNRMRGAS